MSRQIVRWDEAAEHDRLIAHVESQVLEPEPLHPGWLNLVSQRSARAVVIAPKSRHMWIATWGGVLSWRQRDESTYYRYSSEHGLAGNAAACICLDEAERPWVGHEEGGLSYFDGRRWRVYAHLRAEVFRRVAGAGARGGVWAATADALHYVAGPERLPVPAAPGEEGARSIAAMLSDGDELLVGNDAGIFRLRADGTLARVAPETIRACVALSRDGAGRVWVGTPDAVYLLAEAEAGGDPAYDGRAGRVREIAAGKEHVWLLTTGGVSQVRGGRWGPLPPSAAQAGAPAVQTIAASSNDDYLWVGTDRVLSSLHHAGGAQVYWDHQLLPLHAEDELNNIGRCAAAGPGGRVWVGTAGGLVACGPGDGWSVEPAAGDVRAVCVAAFDAAGAARETLWLQSWPKGYCTLEQIAQQPPGVPVALAAGHDGMPYGLTSRGLWRLGGVPALVAEGLPASAHCLAQTPGGAWWIGTAEGVYRCDAAGCQLASERPGPLLAEVYALAAVGGVLWAATDAGLWARTRRGWARHEAQGSPRAFAAASGGAQLWLARDDALVRYAPGPRAVDMRYTPAEHGLAGLRVAALVESGGRLWIATRAGISCLKLN